MEGFVGIEIASTCEVKLIRGDASDQMVVDAARVSTRGGQHNPGDEEKNPRLINFLMRDGHGSPFEHGSFTFFICAPVFVFREFHRHRAGWSYNEESGRYKELEGRFYIPDHNRPLRQQGKPGDYHYVPGSMEQHQLMEMEMRQAYAIAYASYQRMLAAGITREVARMVLPVGIYSSMYATCNPRSLMHFLSLRTRDARASVKTGPMWEIDRLVAQKLEDQLALAMPMTYHAYNVNGRVAP